MKLYHDKIIGIGMKKMLFAIFVLIIVSVGCDSIEEGIIDPHDAEFLVETITLPTKLEYFGEETKLNTSITLTNTNLIIAMWVKVASQDGNVNITYHKNMSKSDSKTYSVAIPMDKKLPNLVYTIDYFYKTAIQSQKKIATKNFTYDNMQNNTAPVISNPLFYYSNKTPSLIDTIKREEKFILSIEVDDDNGLSDIDSVYIKLYNYQNPNSIRITRIELFDDGKFEDGDEIKGDGIYSRKNFFPAVAEGKRRFEFYATDRAKFTSNVITHDFVVVK